MAIQRLSNAGQSGYRYKSLIAGITPVASVPTIGTATALTYSTASVTFTAPGAYGATTFTATSSPGGFTGTSASSPITVSGLSELTSYTFTVTATNASGTSSPSAASSSVTTPAAFTPESGYDSLAVVSVGAGGLSSVTFTGVPSGYKHLQLRIFAQTNRATYGTDNVSLQVNGDTGANYIYHYLRGSGSAATAAASSTSETSIIELLSQGAGTTTSGVFGTGIVDILDYGSSAKNKTIRSLNGSDLNGAYSGSYGYVSLVSGLWRNTAPITSLTLAPVSGSAFTQYSSFALYGVK
jgi:hypothetical protein